MGSKIEIWPFKPPKIPLLKNLPLAATQLQFSQKTGFSAKLRFLQEKIQSIGVDKRGPPEVSLLWVQKWPAQPQFADKSHCNGKPHLDNWIGTTLFFPVQGQYRRSRILEREWENSTSTQVRPWVKAGLGGRHIIPFHSRDAVVPCPWPRGQGTTAEWNNNIYLS